MFDENGKKLCRLVGNTVGKGEITLYEQFLLFPQCFQKACFPGASKGVIVWERVNTQQNLRLVHIESICRQQKIETEKLKFVSGRVESIVGKEENAGYQHLLIFLQCFQNVS